VETIRLWLDGGIARIRFHRPEKANALDARMWQELREAMQWLDETHEARVGILSAAGAHFSAGLDLDMLTGLKAKADDPCGGRMRETIRRDILELQDVVTSIERYRKPVIAAVHAACVGGGVDIDPA
jgi:enoyl-CoA hydratase